MASHMSPESKPAEKKWVKRLLWIIPASIVGLLAVAYFAGVAVFTLYFMPGTTLDGADVSMRPVTEVADEKSASLADFQTHVTGNGLDFTVTGSDIDLVYDGTSYANDALAQVNAWAWPYELTQTREITAEATSSFDSAKLAAVVQPEVEKVKADAGESETAMISYDADQGLFVLDRATISRYLNADTVTQEVSAAIEAGQTEIQTDDACLDLGTELSDAVNKANSYLNATLTLNLGDSKAYELKADKIAGWVKIGDDLSVSLDKDAIDEWSHGDLSKALDTKGTKRTYTRPDGKECTVADGNNGYSTSTYGWSIDGDKVADQIIEALEKGEPSTVKLATYSEAAQYNPGGQDWGDRYVDVDITNQHATLFDGGKVIWEADITTGQPNLGYDTPTGVWVVNNKESGDINLRGPEAEDGSLEWDSHVQFWIPFVDNLVGFHNAPWQSVYGGDIYTYYGSHGCVRMSYEDAEKLYAQIKKGDVVVVHN